MKRSEAITLIYKTVDEISYNQCEEILTILEKAGMSHKGYFAQKSSKHPEYWYPDSWEPEEKRTR